MQKHACYACAPLKEVIKEIEEEEILEDVMDKEMRLASVHQSNSVDGAGGATSDELIQQGDFIEDFTAPEYSFAGEIELGIYKGFRKTAF